MDCTTRRGKTNRWYGVNALSVLGDDPLCAWLGCSDMAALKAGKTVKVRWTILSELGRLRDPETIREVAHEICEWKPRAAEAVRWIREQRTGRALKPSVSELTDALLKVLNDYKTSHSGMSHRMVRDALRQVHEAVAVAESTAKVR